MAAETGIQSAAPVKVTPDNFIRAESDLYFSHIVGDNGFGHFKYSRELTPLDKQLVIRQNRQKIVRDALVQLATTLPDTKAMFGTKDTTDPVRRLIGAANAWGGNPERDALYLTVVPPRNDGTTAYELVLRNVPVDGFWSVTVYDAAGYFTPNDGNAYSVNNLTATRSDDGAVVIRFGGRDDMPNYLPLVPGWNYTVRLYRPRAVVLNGEWTFPTAQVAE
jgi:hypothetical protein